MTSLVRVACPQCGPLELDAHRVYREVHPESGPVGYRFECCYCRVTISRPVTPRIDAILEALECTVVLGHPIDEAEIRLFVEELEAIS